MLGDPSRYTMQKNQVEDIIIQMFYEPHVTEKAQDTYTKYIHTSVLMHFTDALLICRQVIGHNGMCLRLDYRNSEYRD